jgi:hypothetical protein
MRCLRKPTSSLELRSVPATTTPHAMVDDELATNDIILAAGNDSFRYTERWW